MADLEELKRKRDQLTARIQAAEARQRAGQKKEDDRVKVLVGAALLDHIKQRGSLQPLDHAGLLSVMAEFLNRPGDRKAVLGESGCGSEAFTRLTRSQSRHTQGATSR